MSRRWWTLALLVVIMLALPAWALAQAKPRDKMTFQFAWIPYGKYAGFYMAKELGYYDQAGLDVTFIRGHGMADSLKTLAAGHAELGEVNQMGSVGGRARGALNREVLMFHDKAMEVFYCLEKHGIRKPKDLEGKSIAAPAGDSQRNMFPIFARVAGIDTSKVRWITVDGAQRDAMVLTRKADAATGFALQIPVVTKMAKAQNLNVHFIKWADHGFDLYSNVLLTSDEFARSNPNLVRGFVQATIRGHEAAFEAPDEAIAIMLKQQPTLDREVARAELDIVKDLVLTEGTKRHGIGWFNEKMLQNSVDWVAEVFKVEKPPVASLYTNEFLK